jgi:nitrite reductase/ring-hydroxylating ferredoxin subunit
MDLPASVAALEDQLGRDDDIMPDPELFHSPEVLAAERQRIFVRPAIAIDHVSRLAGDGRYFRFDAAGRSILVTRDGDGGLHALRNLCLHAGYPVCDAEEGPAERLVCPYHGWEYALDGRLVEPELSARIDPARLRLQHYAVGVRDGLIFVDLSGVPGSPPQPDGSLPAWLVDASVCRRVRWSTTWNWKFTLQFLKSSPQLFFDDGAAGGDWRAFGPLSLIFVRRNRAALLHVIPKFAGHTDFQLVEMAAPDAPPPAAETEIEDRVAEALRRGAENGPPARLDRRFFAWYWSLMSAA